MVDLIARWAFSLVNFSEIILSSWHDLANIMMIINPFFSILDLLSYLGFSGQLIHYNQSDYSV